MQHSESTLTLTTSAFEHNADIPSEYTCDGANLPPALAVSGVPENAQSLALIMDDPDIPTQVKEQHGIEAFDHWVLFNIPPETAEITQDTTGLAGANSAGKNAYTGPCPPTEYEPTKHRYIFRLAALDTTLDLPEGATKADVEAAMEGHVLASAELIGVYDRTN